MKNRLLLAYKGKVNSTLLPYDVRRFENSTREGMAERIQVAEDFQLPKMDMWNYDPCKEHGLGWVEQYWDTKTREEKSRTVYDRPKPGCRKCGIHFRQHQRVGIMWLYMRKRGLLADPMGTGKTVHGAGLLALLHQTGEIYSVGRAIIVPRSPAIGQWQTELLRMLPGLNLIVAQGDPQARRDLYASDWTTLLISPQTFNNDVEIFENHFNLSLLLTDDIDALRNRDTDTSKKLKRIGRRADRFIAMTGTPVQKRLSELWSTLEIMGGEQAFGTLDEFEKRHVTKTNLIEFDERTNLQVASKTVTAYRNMNEVKRKMAPMVLRRRVEDLKDVTLPEVNVSDVFLDLYPAQRNKYLELRRGVIEIIKEQGTNVKHLTALTKLHYGAQICGGLATLGEADGPNTSVKMDWILEKLQGELEDEKVVLFANYKNSVRALQDRFRSSGIGFETVWGEEPNRDARKRSQDRFWEDKNCRVLIGTQAIEQSLNLQISRHLINMDMIMNPSRMAQLAGRIRRDGSAHKHIFVHNLLTTDTQEERYLSLLEREAALSSFIWDENNELFAQLNPMTLLQLITG